MLFFFLGAIANISFSNWYISSRTEGMGELKSMEYHHKKKLKEFSAENEHSSAKSSRSNPSRSVTGNPLKRSLCCSFTLAEVSVNQNSNAGKLINWLKKIRFRRKAPRVPMRASIPHPFSICMDLEFEIGERDVKIRNVEMKGCTSFRMGTKQKNGIQDSNRQRMLAARESRDETSEIMSCDNVLFSAGDISWDMNGSPSDGGLTYVKDGLAKDIGESLSVGSSIYSTDGLSKDIGESLLGASSIYSMGDLSRDIIPPFQRHSSRDSVDSLVPKPLPNRRERIFQICRDETSEKRRHKGRKGPFRKIWKMKDAENERSKMLSSDGIPRNHGTRTVRYKRQKRMGIWGWFAASDMKVESLPCKE